MKRNAAYTVLYISCLACVLVPLLLLPRYGISASMDIERLLKLLLAALAGAAAGGLLSAGAGSLAGKQLASAAAQTAVTATAVGVTALVAVTVVATAPPTPAPGSPQLAQPVAVVLPPPPPEPAAEPGLAEHPATSPDTAQIAEAETPAEAPAPEPEAPEPAAATPEPAKMKEAPRARPAPEPAAPAEAPKPAPQPEPKPEPVPAPEPAPTPVRKLKRLDLRKYGYMYTTIAAEDHTVLAGEELNPALKPPAYSIPYGSSKYLAHLGNPAHGYTTRSLQDAMSREGASVKQASRTRQGDTEKVVIQNIIKGRFQSAAGNWLEGYTAVYYVYRLQNGQATQFLRIYSPSVYPTQDEAIAGEKQRIKF